jgi:hypothetical protein
MSATIRMGFEGLLYTGTAGTTAATEIPQTRDITETFPKEYGETSRRPTGGGIIRNSQAATAVGYECTFQTLNDTGNAVISGLKAAAISGTPVAFRSRAFSTGTGFDGDVNVEMSIGKPYKGEQTIDWTVTPYDLLRAYQLDV